MRGNDLHNLSRTDICLWLDFYGELLTSHTRDVLELHYSEDMSLSEIAENLGITRQAVHDRIRQGMASLISYEEKLRLTARYKDQKTILTEAMQALDDGKMPLVRRKLQQLKANL